MGCFDEVYGLGLKCPAGHPLDGLQTKSLGRLMQSYDCSEGRIKLSPRAPWEYEDEHRQWPPQYVGVYTECEQCPPEKVHTYANGWISREYPWCYFGLTLDPDGTILEVERLSPNPTTTSEQTGADGGSDDV